jgi:endonuclease/exonuclease/phosphatase family metal-dependent hydrolase
MALAAALAARASAQPIESLRVMTYNVWVGGNAAGLPLSHTADVVQAAQADVVGLQEIRGSGPTLAAQLGFYYHGFNADIGILSRYPIVETLGQGVKLQLSTTQQAYIFDVHLAPYPYEPYGIRDGIITTEDQAISSAQTTRGAAIMGTLNAMSSALNSGLPVFLTGDFNEPSHLDWTAEAAAAGLHFGMKVDWPTSRAVVDRGMVDAFRELRPDEVADRGETWTPGYPAPNLDPIEVHDRIDFVYYAGLNVSATEAQVLGYDANDGNTDVGIQPYPSDHRSVVVEFQLGPSALFGDLNSDSLIDSADWMLLRTWQHADLAGLSRGEAYSRGDLTGDFKNDHADFVAFKSLYEQSYGSGAFSQMLAKAPEPGSATLAVACFITLAALPGRARRFEAAGPAPRRYPLPRRRASRPPSRLSA